MNRFYSDREAYGPDFDDRLIQLVRSNPAIYDVNHPNYRRNPVRVSIWDSIATELGAPSKFLQTKWKNIRYNYLQEIKCLETGHVNANIRKRRFTEDLSFLQNTAQSYNVKKGTYRNSSYNSSDNDSNSYIYPDPPALENSYEVIEIEHSDDGSQHEFEPTIMNNMDNYVANDDEIITKPEIKYEPRPEVTIQTKTLTRKSLSPRQDNLPAAQSPVQSLPSNPSSPLLTPLVVIGNGQHNEPNGEVTIERIPKNTQQRIRPIPPSQIMENATKRKSMPAPFPVLTPINDPIELYCLSLVDSLRNMPRSERERVKFEFANILKDAKYKDQS